MGLLLAAALFAAPLSAAAQASAYVQTNIISDGAVPAAQMDPTLINPWGVSIGPQFWIDSPGSGFSLVDDASGNKSFAVAVPPANSTSPHGTPLCFRSPAATHSFSSARWTAPSRHGIRTRPRP
jgi:opacity protein-like surface antigen